MAKGTKLSEFGKGDITAVKSVRKSHREISKALGCGKTVICNYLKRSNNYGIRKPACRPAKLSPQFKCLRIKKKTLSTSKILKSLVDAHCSTGTIRTKKLSIRKELIVQV